uniref:Uncharacterized protein n=1 Tax=Timema douglasi TaxID=61478 RepID=A0A7R8VKW6_TIMDO|nr:unnamed protein product [Timema douglasi]
MTTNGLRDLPKHRDGLIDVTDQPSLRIQNKSPEPVNPGPSTSTFGHSSSPLWVQEMFVEEDPDDTSLDYDDTTLSTPTSVETISNKEKKRFALSPPEDSFSKKRNTVTDKLEKGMAEASVAFIQAVTNLESTKNGRSILSLFINKSMSQVPAFIWWAPGFCCH